MRGREGKKDPDAKPTVGFALPRVGDAEAAGCGAARLLELMNEERNGRDAPAGLVAARNFS